MRSSTRRSRRRWPRQRPWRCPATSRRVCSPPCQSLPRKPRPPPGCRAPLRRRRRLSRLHWLLFRAVDRYIRDVGRGRIRVGEKLRDVGLGPAAAEFDDRDDAAARRVRRPIIGCAQRRQPSRGLTAGGVRSDPLYIGMNSVLSNQVQIRMSCCGCSLRCFSSSCHGALPEICRGPRGRIVFQKKQVLSRLSSRVNMA